MTNYLSLKIKHISFFSMIMVVILHCYNLDTKQSGLVLEQFKNVNWFIQTFISNGLTRIAVPIFFLLSGFLFFLGFKNLENEILTKIFKRIKTLVFPYFFWVFFGILFYFILQSIPQLQHFFTKKLIKDYNSLEWFNAFFVNLISYQLWFLRDLIVMVFLTPIIYFLIQKINYFYFLVLLSLWFCNQDNLFFTSEAILFFSLGSFLALKKSELLNKKSKNAVLLVIIWFMTITVKTVLELYFNKNAIQVILSLKTTIVIGIFAFWTFYDVLIKLNFKKLNFLSPIMNFSFFIYVIHEPILTVVKKLFFRTFGTSQNNYLVIYCISPFITILICVLIGLIIKKKFLNFYTLITGNR